MSNSDSVTTDTGTCQCEECAGKVHASAIEHPIYAIGNLDVRFPTIGVEREFQQRERAMHGDLPAARGERLAHVLRANPHLWSRVCFVLSIGNVPAYIVTPSSQHVLQRMLEAITGEAEPDVFAVMIGRRIGTAPPASCGGLLAPIIICDQIYPSKLEEWIEALGTRVEGALKAKNFERKRFSAVAREVFRRVVQSTENIGAMESHRALNFVLVQHPGLALSVHERPNSVLDRIETRTVQGTDLRKIIAVILTFVDRATGVPERVFCRVDVTEEWPFLIDGPSAGIPALGLLPYVENALLGPGY